MEQTALLHPPLTLNGDILKLRAWRMPDMLRISMRMKWWITPLDDHLPLIRLNRIGAGTRDRHRWPSHGEQLAGSFWKMGVWSRWRNRSVAFGAVVLAQLLALFLRNRRAERRSARHKWDLLLQQIREGWSGKEELEGGDHLTEFHLKDITKREGHFDTS